MGTRAGLLFVNKLVESIEAPKDQDFPEFILHNNSRVPDRTLSIVYGEESPVDELIRSLEMMKQWDVDYIVSTCITSYFFLNQLEDHLTFNIVNPIDLIFQKLQKEYKHHIRIGLLATTGTIRSELFHKKFMNSSFELVFLDDDDQEEKFMKSVYMEGGFKSAQIDDEAYCLFQDAVTALKEKKIDLIIGACTEVQIGFNGIAESLPYIDLIDVLVTEVIRLMDLKSKMFNKDFACNG